MAVLAEYLSATVSASNVNADITAGDLTNTGGLGLWASQAFAYPTQPVRAASVLTGATSATSAVSTGSFFEFTITPINGKELNLTSLDFWAARGNTSTPRGWVLRSSIDTYATNLGTADCTTVRPNWPGSMFSVDLSGASFQALTSAITFRFYIYAPSNASQLDWDNITINGTISGGGGASNVPGIFAQWLGLFGGAVVR